MFLMVKLLFPKEVAIASNPKKRKNVIKMPKINATI
jgi:hypothetical protein